MYFPNPILQFRVAAASFEDPIDESFHYDCVKGTWIDSDGVPLIKKLIDSQLKAVMGPTTKTATREAIDQSESASGQTMLTKTREGFSQTTLTRTREGVDQSERILGLPQTRLTETREDIDRPEQSSW